MPAGPVGEVPTTAIGDLYDAIDEGPGFGQAILDVIGGLVPSDMSTFNHTHLGPRSTVYDVHPGPHRVHREAMGDFVRLHHEHPLITRFAQIDAPAPTRWRDVVDPRAFERSELYDVYYRPMGITHQLAIKVGGEGGTITSVALSRSGVSFSDEERSRLAGAQAHLRRAYDLVRRLRHPDPSIEGLVELGLSRRQAEVAVELCRGGTNAQLARRLGIGVGTLRKHLEQIFAVVGVDNRTSAVAALHTRGSTT